MKQKKMKTSYAKFVQVGCFDKGKFIEGKLKVFSDMDITLTESETEVLYSLSTPRQIEKFVSIIIKDRL